MTLKLKNFSTVFLLAGLLCGTMGTAQNSQNDLTKTILELDATFWKAYNSCDLTTFRTLFTDDIEFYHDKGGLTETLPLFMEQISENVCGNKNVRLRREVLEGSVNIYPLNNYGAIISGDHIFYLKEGETKERLVEKAKFTNVWKFENEQWKMSRVLSYDHQPVSENIFKKETILSKDELAIFVGNYKAPKNGPVKIFLSEQGKLTMDAGRMVAELHSEEENIFFIKEAPLVFEFIKDADGKIIKFTVKENGKQVEEAIKIN
ncbi:DUF4440 domain-containing protein [Winogradskyella maritima]|uniref:DUF4440 domain-containing protein n=1 Tax=Winogradskyella maritima TaxID=1517766 RepID=A0ABV8AG19_9FLAO|nr:DUF4440 domain-containing protein [Winogradskyella maritima]